MLIKQHHKLKHIVTGVLLAAGAVNRHAGCAGVELLSPMCPETPSKKKCSPNVMKLKWCILGAFLEPQQKERAQKIEPVRPWACHTVMKVQTRSSS